MTLAASMIDPPPSARIASAPAPLSAAQHAARSATSGFATILSTTTTGAPAWAAIARAASLKAGRS
jgi:hypothetical protein